MKKKYCQHIHFIIAHLSTQICNNNNSVYGSVVGRYDSWFLNFTGILFMNFEIDAVINR